ncbi:hypothetical protein ACLB1R_33805 [Escherichia coli]
MVVFHPLGEQHIASIAQIQLKRLYKHLEERGYEIHISCSGIRNCWRNGSDPVYGARPLKRAIGVWKNPLAQQILSGELVPGTLIHLEVIIKVRMHHPVNDKQALQWFLLST